MIFFNINTILKTTKIVKEITMKDLTKGNIYKTFFLFGLPIVLSGLLTQTYSTIDTAIAGQYLGDQGLAAIGATAPLITFISAIFWGYYVGFSIYTAKLFSEGSYQKIKSAVLSTRILGLIVAVAISLFMIIFYRPVFDFLNIEESLRADAFKYFAVYIAGIYIITLTNANVSLLNSFGISSYPLFISAVSAVLNIAGNIFTIISLKMGVDGLALSTVFAALVGNILYEVKYRQCLKELGVNKQKSHIGLSYIKPSVSYALPTMFQQMIMYVASLFISPLVNGIGTDASASYSVISKIYDINASVYQNSTKAFTNYAAQCSGHKEYNKIKKGVRVGLLQSSLFVAPFVLVCVILPKQICSLFFKANASATAIQYAVLFTRYALPFIYFNVVNNLFHGLYRATKSAKFLFFVTFFGAAVRYVSSIILIPYYGMTGFCAGWIISWILEAVFSFALYLSGKWNPDNVKSKTKNQPAN